MSATQTLSENTVASGVSASAVPVAALFQGYDTFIGSGRSSAVAGEFQEYGGTADLYYKTCYDTESVMNALNISASVGVAFGPVSVDAKTDFVHELSLTTYSVTVLVYTHNVKKKRVYTNVDLKVPPPDDPDQFFRVYGDSFVSSIELGSEFAAAYVFYSQSETERTELTTSLQAHGVFPGGSVSTELSTSLSKVTSSFKSQTTVNMHMAGVSVAFPEPDKIIDFALKFNALPVDENPAIVSYGTSGYEIVPGMPATPNLIKNRETFVGEKFSPGISADIAKVSTTLDQVSLIQKIYQTYGYSGDTLLITNRDELLASYLALQGWIKSVEAAANSIPADPVVNFPGTPVIRFELKTPVVFGSTGGNAFPENNDIDHAWVMNGLRPSSILLRGGAEVDRITITYLSAGNDSSTYTHGAEGGGDGPLLELQPGEYISRVYGRFNPEKNIHQLAFFTSFGQSMRWPANPTTDHTIEKDYTYKEGTVLGFRGRSQYRMQQLAPVVIVFSPAAWEPVAPVIKIGSES